MKTISLTKGYRASVDDVEHEALSVYSWHALVKKRSDGTERVYAARRKTLSRGKTKIVLMHREVFGKVESGMDIDHINGNSLDNRRENLREATRQQNLQNQRKKGSVCGVSTSSGFKGVSWDKARGKWRAAIKVNGKSFFLGRFAEQAQAASAYDVAALEMFTDYARINATRGES